MRSMLVLAVTAVVGSFALSTLYAQQDHQHPTEASVTKVAPTVKAAETAKPEVFCETMKTGQLCSHGTSSALGLTAEKAEAWVAAVRKYNRAVNEATMQLQSEAKGSLSATQMAEVERWFAVGVNVQMNELLSAPSKAKTATK